VTLADFLLQRIAEDEVVARAATRGAWTAVGTEFVDDAGHPEEMTRGYVDVFYDGPTVIEEIIRGADAMHIARHDPARVLAECEAKRQIVERWPDPFGQWTAEQAEAARAAKDFAVRALASVYADHPDYCEEWAL
jgi:hypothetical protein